MSKLMAVKRLFVIHFFVFLGCSLSAEEPVQFADNALKNRVELELNTEHPTPSEMLELESIHHYYFEGDVQNLQGLEYAKNLKRILFHKSPIKDVSALRDLAKLEEVRFDACSLSDLSSVLSVLHSKPQLHTLSLHKNQITELSPLLTFDLQNIKKLNLGGNPLSKEAFEVQLPQIRQKYPQLSIGLPFHPNQLIFPAVFLIAACIGTIVLIVRSRTEKGFILELLMGLTAAGVGCFFAMMAQILYEYIPEIMFFNNGNDNPPWVGGVSGGILGFLAGVWFAQFLKTRFGRKDSSAQIFGKGLLAGIGLGVVCSTLVHGVLMLAYRDNDFQPMGIGALFGLGAGALLAIALLIVFMLGRQFNWIKPTGANDGND